MKQSKDKKLLVIDEAWSLLSQTSEASYIFEIVKTCRKYNMGILLITQDVADLIDSRAGHAVLANTAYSLLLRQKPAIINDIVKAFSLSKTEKEYLLSATRGSGILITDNEHTELDVVASPKEHDLITTDPNEKEIEKKEKKELDPKKYDDYYLDKDLSTELKNDIVNLGYKIGNFTDLEKGRKKLYWVRCTPNESAEHGFHVAIIKKELSQYTTNFSDNRTVDADLVFKHKKKTYAIEIETGKRFTDFRQNKKKKFKQKLEQYRDGLIILLTDSDMKPYYQRIFLTNPILVKSDLRGWLATVFKPYNKRRK